MGRGLSGPFRPFIFLRCLLLLGVFALVTAEGEEGEEEGVELGPRLPGDPKYWLRLKSVSFSEGSLEPSFDGKLNDFKLTVPNPGVTSFTITIRLDLQHYDLLALPKILVNGKPLKYSPLNAIVVPVVMNETIAAEDKVVSITMEDPSGKKFGGFLGFGGKSRSHEYRIRCLQPPEFQNVVKIDNLKVKLDNKEMTPDKEDPKTGQYWYTLPASASGAYLQAFCGQYSTSMTVNGITVSSGQDFWIDMQVPHVTWLVECLYEDGRWTETPVGRTYQVHMSHLQDKFKPPNVRMMPQDGLCEEDKDIDGGFYCRAAHRDNLRLIVTFEERSVEVYLDTGVREQNLLSGIPTQVTLSSTIARWHLVVKGMKEVKVPLKMVVAQRCHALTCPQGWVPSPTLNGGEDAAIHLCYSQHCNLEDDSTTCCREAGTPCEEYGFHFKCRAGFRLFDKGFCKSTPCEELLDHQYCCAPETREEVQAEQFNMEKGNWKKWFENTDKHAKKAVEQLGDRVEFYTTLKVKGEPRKEKVDATGEALHEVVAENFGVAEKDVKIDHSDGLDDLETYRVVVKSMEGEQKEGELVQKAKTLVEGKAAGGPLVDLIHAELKKKGSDFHVAANFTSAVKKVAAPEPTIDIKMLVEVSKSADLGKDGEGEELAPEVSAALREAILFVADVPDKEKMNLQFKKVGSAGHNIPDSDELISIVGHIKLPRGKEGTKEILVAKLRNAQRVSRKINKVLQKDVEEAEEKPDSRIVGGKKDYKVFNLDVTGVSKTPKGVEGYKVPSVGVTPAKALKTWLGLTTTTTTTLDVDGASLLRTASAQCVEGPQGRSLGNLPSVQSCDANNGHQAWFYTKSSHTLENFLGLCLAADLNGPRPQPGYRDYSTDTGPQVLQKWVAEDGAAPVHLWACNGHWQQQFMYIAGTGQFQMSSSQNPGLCLEVQDSRLVLALCNKQTFSQQFWLEKSLPGPFLPAEAKSALDVPVFVKLYFDGKVAMKSSDNTYDFFKIAPFSQKRAAFYLTQGCSPVPTFSCGTPVPDMPNVFVGQSLIKVSKKVDQLPWMNALKASPKKSGMALCVYDDGCKKSESTVGQLQEFAHGCNAGGKPKCRYCGTDKTGECPQWYKCVDSGLEIGAWSKEHREWCCDKFSIGCDPPYQCMEDLENWRDWQSHKKLWCCSYQMVACENECSKKDPATFRENHDYWCSTFGTKQDSIAETAKREKSKFELMIMQMFNQVPGRHLTRRIHALGVWPVMLAVFGALAAAVWGVWRSAKRHSGAQRCSHVEAEADEPLVAAA